MAETKTPTEKTERTTERGEQAFHQAEQAVGTMMDNNRRTLQTMMEYNRSNINAINDFAWNIQGETLRLTESLFSQLGRYQQNYIKTAQELTDRLHGINEKTLKETQSRVEHAVDQTMELVSSGARPGRR